MNFPIEKLAKTFKSSTSLQLLTLLIAADLLIAPCLPNAAQMIKPELIPSNSMRVKIADFMSVPTNPDVVIMGSSLVLAPAIHCDAAMLKMSDKEKGIFRKNQAKSYTKAKYFENLLSQSSGKENLNIYNLGIPSAMAADNYRLLEEMLDCNIRPNLIILGLAARDLVNCTRVDPEQSPLCDEVKRFHKEKNFTAADRVKNVPAVIGEHIDAVKNDLATIKSLTGDKVGEWRRHGFEAQAQSEQAVQDVVLPTADAIEQDRIKYSKFFIGATPEVLRGQLDYAERIVKLANQAKIPIVIVNMPVTATHKELLNQELSDTYQSGIEALAERNGCPLIDMDQACQFDADKDFRDSVHLNAKGGRKFYQELVANLADHHILTKSIASTEKPVH